MTLSFFLVLPVTAVGCTVTTSSAPFVTTESSRLPEESSSHISEQPNPRALASLQLTEQGKELLAKGRPDDALRVLERAINLDPANGHNYYYVSEAWLLKGNESQAGEFNRLALIHLEGEPDWMRRVMEQKERIGKLRKE